MKYLFELVFDWVLEASFIFVPVFLNEDKQQYIKCKLTVIYGVLTLCTMHTVKEMFDEGKNN